MWPFQKIFAESWSKIWCFFRNIGTSVVCCCDGINSAQNDLPVELDEEMLSNVSCFVCCFIWCVDLRTWSERWDNEIWFVFVQQHSYCCDANRTREGYLCKAELISQSSKWLLNLHQVGGKQEDVTSPALSWPDDGWPELPGISLAWDGFSVCIYIYINDCTWIWNMYIYIYTCILRNQARESNHIY